MTADNELIKVTDGNTNVRERLQRLRVALAHGGDINITDINGYTPLYRAAYQGALPLVEALLAAGASLAPSGAMRNTPLHGVVNGHITDREAEPIIGVLIAAGLSPNVRNIESVTPLQLAARNDLIESSKLLLKAGAIVNANDNTRKTPLHEAAEQGSQEMCSMLLAHGADPNRTNRYGMSATDFCRDKQTLKLLHGVTGSAPVPSSTLPSRPRAQTA